MTANGAATPPKGTLPQNATGELFNSLRKLGAGMDPSPLVGAVSLLRLNAASGEVTEMLLKGGKSFGPHDISSFRTWTRVGIKL